MNQLLRIETMAQAIARLLLPGSVAMVDTLNARLRVRCGELLTGWLPWLTPAGGSMRAWRAPSVGEQCLLLCPSGRIEGAFVLCGIYSDAMPAPETAQDVHAMHYNDGAVLRYDQVNHVLQAALPATGTATISAPGGVTIEGNITVTGDVVAGGISLIHHVHGGIQPGGANTGAAR